MIFSPYLTRLKKPGFSNVDLFMGLKGKKPGFLELGAFQVRPAI